MAETVASTAILSIEARANTKPGFDKAEAHIDAFRKHMQLAERETAKSARIMRQGFAQVGYQIQDISVQLQGGQSPFIVLAQQGSQIASIFGAGGAMTGAVVAVGAALAAYLMPNVFDSTSGLEKLGKASEDVDKTFKSLESGTLILSDAFLKMAEQSNAAAMIELRRQKGVLVAAMKETQEEVLSQAGDFNTMLSRAALKTDPLTGAYLAGISAAPDQIKKQFSNLYGVTEENMDRLQQLSAAALKGTSDDIEAFLSEMLRIQALPGTTDQFNKLAESLSSLHVALINGKTQVSQLEAAMADLDGFISNTREETDKTKDSVQEMIDKLQHEALTLDMTSSQIAVYDAYLAKANETQLVTIQRLAQEIEGRKAIVELEKNEAKAIEERYKAQEKALNVIEKQKMKGMTGPEKVAAEYDEEIRITEEALRTLGWLETSHAEIIAKLHEDKAAAVAKAAMDEANARKEAMVSEIGTMRSLTSSIESALSEGTAARKAAFVAAKGMAVAEAIMNAELASSKALASLPPPANIPMAAAIKALGYINAGVIAGQTVASFEGGGFTGYGSRVGGLDGKGGMPAIVHPNESIIDHTKGGAAAKVEITIVANDTRGFDELLASRRGQIISMINQAMNNRGRAGIV